MSGTCASERGNGSSPEALAACSTSSSSSRLSSNGQLEKIGVPTTVKLDILSTLDSTSSSNVSSNNDTKKRISPSATPVMLGGVQTLEQVSKAHPVRVRIQSLVEHELRMRYPFREDWQRKCNNMSIQLEEVIFRNAKSLDEYRDESTLSLRLVEIFMAKKKKEISARDREEGEEIYNSILDKANGRWLTGEEIIVLLMRCSRKIPCLLSMNDNAFMPTSGCLFHFGSPVVRDGYNWVKVAGTNLVQEHRFVLSVGGQPRVWVSLNVDIQRKVHRRTYWLAENAAMGVLVHYLNDVPSFLVHSKSCFCLACLFEKESGQISHTPIEMFDPTIKRSRND